MTRHLYTLGILACCIFANVSCMKHVSRYSTVYIDLDGTAVDTTGHIRPATIAAVQRFKDRGGHLGIATGRSLEQAREEIAQMKPNLPLVLANGGLIYDLETKKQRTLGLLDRITIQTFAELAVDDQAIKGVFLYFPNTTLIYGKTKNSAETIREMGLQQKVYDHALGTAADSLIKIVLVCHAGRLDHLAAAITEKLTGTARIVISSPTTLEVVPHSTSKWNAVQLIAKERRLSTDQIVAFGDSGNDLELLAGVGCGVAMWNGRPEVKETADLIIGPNYSDSIAKFLDSPIMR